MLKTFDLSIHQDTVNQMLNDPSLRLLSMKISCSEETGYTVATLRFSPCAKREIRFNRYVERYILLDTGHPEVDKILEDTKKRLIRQHVFPTSEGVVVVLDYQVRTGRQVGV